MLNIGERITTLRKQQSLSQDELAKKTGLSRTIICNYERNINTPSVEGLVKLAGAFNVSLDFLIGELAAFDKEVIKRLEDIERLDLETRQHLFFIIDNVIQNFKTKQAFGR